MLAFKKRVSSFFGELLVIICGEIYCIKEGSPKKIFPEGQEQLVIKKRAALTTKNKAIINKNPFEKIISTVFSVK